MNLEFDADAAAFLEKALPYLQKESKLHSLIISLTERLQRLGKQLAKAVRGVNDQGTTVMVGVQTDSDRPIIISRAASEEANSFARILANTLPVLPGVSGPTPTVDDFAKTWSDHHSCPLRLDTNLRLFELTLVTAPPACSGTFRAVRVQDEDLILSWLREFAEEATPHDPKRSEEEMRGEIQDAVKKEQYFLWEDQGQVVCLVGSKRETSQERWIAPVYTPPKLRGHGYGTALVAEVSRRIITSGKTAMLFTDLSNPTSNSIYQKVGYRPLADFKQFFFTH